MTDVQGVPTAANASLAPHLKPATSPLTQELRGQMAVLTTDAAATAWDLRHRAADRIEALEAALRELEASCDATAAATPAEVYVAITDGVPGVDDLRLRTDAARRVARALLQAT